MKKTLAIVILTIVAILAVATVVNATTEAELETYLTTSHTIAGKSVSLTSAEKKQVKDYFASHDLTNDQATFIKNKVDECINIMNKAGVTEISKLSKADKDALLSSAQEAASKVGLRIDTSRKLVVDATTGEPVFDISNGKLVQTGSSNIAYIIISGLAIIAIAGTVIYKKVRA